MNQWDEWYQSHGMLLSAIEASDESWWPSERRVAFSSEISILMIEEGMVDESARGVFNPCHPSCVKVKAFFSATTRRLRFVEWYRGTVLRFLTGHRDEVWPNAYEHAQERLRAYCDLNNVNFNDIHSHLLEKEKDLSIDMDELEGVLVPPIAIGHGCIWQNSEQSTDDAFLRAVSHDRLEEDPELIVECDAASDGESHVQHAYNGYNGDRYGWDHAHQHQRYHSDWQWNGSGYGAWRPNQQSQHRWSGQPYHTTWYGSNAHGSYMAPQRESWNQWNHWHR